MIMKPNNWDSIQEPNGFTPLPVGGYVVMISDANVLRSASGYEYLELTVDIAEGQYKDYYTKDFYSQTGDNKRYRGKYRQGTPQDDRSASYFKGMVSAIEHSNSGYVWDWNEKSLCGKVCGCIFREEEWEYNGKTGMRTVPWKFVSAERIREGNFTVPEPKRLQRQAGGYQSQNNMYADMMPAPGEPYNSDPWK